MKQGLKFFILTVILIAVLIGAFFAYQNLSANIGEITKATESDSTTRSAEAATAADFKAVDTGGNDVKLSDYFGKPCVVNFWATWCGYCVREMPAFESAYKKYGNDINILMVNLTDGDRETLKGANDFLEENAFTFPVLFDTYGEALSAYEAYTIPVTVFIRADGTVFEKNIGALGENELIINTQ